MVRQLERGTFFGNNKRQLALDQVLITETSCGQEPVDWHWHENPHLSYSLYGHCLEKGKKYEHIIQPGSLVFHNNQDAHCNIRHAPVSRNFYIEFGPGWLKKYGLEGDMPGSIRCIKDPFIKAMVNRLYFETARQDQFSEMASESLLLEILGKISGKQATPQTRVPGWVAKVESIIHDEPPQKMTLSYLAEEAGIHPVHLSRNFRNYFHTNLGRYIRTIKVQQATLLLFKDISLTEIAYQSGFFDQSHFIRCFKERYKITPKAFRKIIRRS